MVESNVTFLSGKNVTPEKHQRLLAGLVPGYILCETLNSLNSSVFKGPPDQAELQAGKYGSQLLTGR